MEKPMNCGTSFCSCIECVFKETAVPVGLPAGETTGPVAAVSTSTREALIGRLKELSEEICLTHRNEAIEDAIDALGADAKWEQVAKLRTENIKLRTAAQAVIDRWDTPLWKDVPATAVFIEQLRAALGG